MIKIRSLPSKQQLRGQRLLLRLDLNVPLKGSKITDDFKIISALPTIRQLRTSPLIIISHLGEPVNKGQQYKYQPSLSLQPVARRLKKFLGGHIFITSGSWNDLKKQAEKLRPGDIMLLENLRFWPGEIKNEKFFARQLASLATLYINDAFAVCHRDHASVSAITTFLPSYAGPLLEQEVKNLAKVLDFRSLVVVLGGAKISSKLPLIKKLLPQASTIIMGGGLANTLLKVRGYSIGASLYDAPSLRAARSLVSKKIIIPSDVIIEQGKKVSVQSITRVASQDKIYDIGPVTAALYSSVIVKAKAVIWNGPLGLFENKKFQQGTKTILGAMRKAHAQGAFVLAGGGETVEAIRDTKFQNSFTWISTGGGATLSFLSGEVLPGLQALQI